MPNRLTRSAKLRKYESVYNSYIKKHKAFEGVEKPIRKSPRKIKPKNREKSVQKDKKDKKPLSKWHKYLKKQWNNKKYDNKLPAQKMVEIAKSWKKLRCNQVSK